MVNSESSLTIKYILTFIYYKNEFNDSLKFVYISDIFEHNLNSKPNVCLRLRAAWSDSHLPASPRSKRHFLLVMSMSQPTEYIHYKRCGAEFFALSSAVV